MKAFTLRHISKSVSAAFLMVLVGCASVDREIYDKSQRTPTTEVDIYKDGRMPARNFREIAELVMIGDRSDELGHQRRMVKEAKQLGGNGLIFLVQPAGSTGGLTIFQGVDWLFKGKVIVYEQP